MRSNMLHYHSNFPSHLIHETPHMDLSNVLGHPTVPSAHQASQADEAESQHDGSERYSPPGSPEYRATSPGFSFSRSENGSEASGAFSPQYEVTSPSYSPRGSHDGATSESAIPDLPIQPLTANQDLPPVHFAVAADATSLGHATTEPASAGQRSPDIPAQAFRLFKNAAASPDKPDAARPSTAHGRNTTQQRTRRSAFSFARPASTHASENLTHAASPENGAVSRAQVSSGCQAAEEANQYPAAGSGTTWESTTLHATAHHGAAVLADAVLSELAAKSRQAQAAQAETAQAEAVLSGAVQTEAQDMQTDGEPSAPASQAPGFVWAHSEAFASNGGSNSFFSAGGRKKKNTVRRHNGSLKT